MKKCKYCGNILNKQQKKYCSKDCSNRDNAKKLSKDRKGEGNPMFGKKAWNNGIPATDRQKKILSKIAKKIYKEKGNIIGFKKNNKTKSQFKSGNIPWSSGKKMSDEFCLKIKKAKLKNPWRPNKKQREQISKNVSGERNANWKGGITAENKKRFNSLEWKDKVKIVRALYKNICQNCGKPEAKDVHHIVSYRINKNNNLDNLILYCRSCHIKIEKSLK